MPCQSTLCLSKQVVKPKHTAADSPTNLPVLQAPPLHRPSKAEASLGSGINRTCPGSSGSSTRSSSNGSSVDGEGEPACPAELALYALPLTYDRLGQVMLEADACPPARLPA